MLYELTLSVKLFLLREINQFETTLTNKRSSNALVSRNHPKACQSLTLFFLLLATQPSRTLAPRLRVLQSKWPQAVRLASSPLSLKNLQRCQSLTLNCTFKVLKALAHLRQQFLSARKSLNASTASASFLSKTHVSTCRTMISTLILWSSTSPTLERSSITTSRSVISSQSITTKWEQPQSTLRRLEVMLRNSQCLISLRRTSQDLLLNLFSMLSGVSCGRSERDLMVLLMTSLR